MKIPSWIKSRKSLFLIWVFGSAFVAGTFKSLLDLDNLWQYTLFYTICLSLGYLLCWIQNFYRHKKLVEKEIKKTFEKHFPHDALEKEMVNYLHELLKKKIAEKEAKTRHLWN